MSWTRKGDNARSHPVMQRARSLSSDEREPLEFFGFLSALYEYTGEHTTDYRVELGAVYSVCDSRAQADRLVKLGTRVGAMTRCKVDNLPGFELLRDQDFFHVKTRAEKDWETQQRNDTWYTALTSRVRLRDGDACRWCGKRVAFGNTRGHNGGKYSRTDLLGEPDPAEMDHLEHAPATLDTLVVACLDCNRRRGHPEASGADWTLLPPPAVPYYSKRTAEFLTRNGYPTTASDERPGATPDTAGDPASSRTTPQVDRAPRAIPTTTDADPAGSRSVKTRSAGSGRDRVGSGRVRDGTGRAGSDPPARKRARRGRSR